MVQEKSEKQILIFGDVEFDERQTKAINKMIKGWKKIGAKQVADKILSNYFKPNQETNLIGLHIYLSELQEGNISLL